MGAATHKKAFAALLGLALAASLCLGESSHVFGIHTWDWGADLDVMSWQTGWTLEANLAHEWPNVGGRYAPMCAEGFTIVQRLDYSWESTIPPDPSLYATFAQNCATHWAGELKQYCRYYLIGNEVDLFDVTPADYANCFVQVRDAIKAEQPNAKVIVGHWCNTNKVRSVIQTLGPGGYDGVTCHTGSTVPSGLLTMLDEEGASPGVGVYISEWGWVAGTNPNAQSVMLGFYDDIADWNATHDRQVYCACWYLYPSWMGSTFSLESSPIDNAAFENCTSLGTCLNSYVLNPVGLSDAMVEVSTSSSDLTFRWHTAVPSKTQLWFWQPGWNNGEFRPLDPVLQYDHTVILTGDPGEEYTVMCRSTADDHADGVAGPLLASAGPWAVSVTGVTATGATVDWDTAFPATSVVEYGLTTAYGATESGLGLVTGHAVNLTALRPNTTYHFRVWSEADGYLPHHSGDFAFTTQPLQTDPGFYKEGWNLTSVPVAPDDPDPESVFADLAALGNIIQNNMYRYAPPAGYGLYPHAFTEIERGSGYWLYLTDAPPGATVSVEGDVAADSISIPLADGWSLIGHPFPEARPLADCLVSDGGDTVGFDEAEALGWVMGILYYYDPSSGYGLVRTTGTGDDDSLRPWLGYWINAATSGLWLIVPPEGGATPGDILISGVGASGITQSTATIGWETNVSATSRVEYGQTAAYGQWTALDPALVTVHSVALSGLTPGTLHHYRVWSTADGYADAHSSDNTFWTEGAYTPPVNPGFETGNLTGWSVFGEGIDGVQSGTWYGDCEAHSGTYFAGNAANWVAESGAFYQTFDVSPGRSYTAAAWSWVYWLSGPGTPDPEQRTKSRIGLDPAGGSDPNSASVVWSGWDIEPTGGDGSWDQISVTASAAGPSMTVFLYFHQDVTDNPPGGQWHVNSFDDLTVEEQVP